MGATYESINQSMYGKYVQGLMGKLCIHKYHTTKNIIWKARITHNQNWIIFFRFKNWLTIDLTSKLTHRTAFEFRATIDHSNMTHKHISGRSFNPSEIGKSYTTITRLCPIQETISHFILSHTWREHELRLGLSCEWKSSLQQFWQIAEESAPILLSWIILFVGLTLIC